MKWAVWPLMLCLATSSCVRLEAARRKEAADALTELRGDLDATPPPKKAAFVVLLHPTSTGWERQSSRVFYRPGSYEMLSRPGATRLFAFIDENDDGKWNALEPSASLDVDTRGGETTGVATLRPVSSGPAPPMPIDVTAAGMAEELVKVHSGDLATLDEERFGDRAAAMGFWKPSDFALKYGVGVSFLEAFDPKKTPVLFVHGEQGSPAKFAELVKNLDRSRFQPWFFSYPTGIRLDLATQTLTRIMDDLQHKLGFKDVIVVAHSMGGLVARAFASSVGARKEHPYVRLLVTISTPFGGAEQQGRGLTLQPSPTVLPCWMDLAAGSPFLTSLRQPLPHSVPHHLFFGYAGTSLRDGLTDGTVSLHSMLLPEIQDSATHIEGFAETHDSILTSKAVSNAVNTSLEKALPQGAAGR